jgi:hypothetical protein
MICRPHPPRLHPAGLALCLVATCLRAGPDLASPATPDFLPDPLALREELPALRAQKLWTDYATPEQAALFAGEATRWPVIPATSYRLDGFDAATLGSPVPAPGVHPRILFSPEDVPEIARRLNGTVAGRQGRIENAAILRRTLWDPLADEGKIFQKLARGDTADLQWPEDEGRFVVKDGTLQYNPGQHLFAGYRPRLATTVHAGYLPALLALAAFECLLDGDSARGRQVAAAIAEYYRLREPLIDRLNGEYHERRLAARDEWRPMHQLVSAENLPWAYDCAATWMTPAERAVMQRVIAKATAGKRSYGASAPTRWRDTNWVAWDLSHLMTALAIEGETGADPEARRVGLETLRAFLDWGFSPGGVIFETNGKNASGLKYACLSLTALARRGDNLIGHPHLRAFSLAQCQMVVPTADLNVSNGTWGNTPVARMNAGTLANYFPADPAADWLLRIAAPDQENFDATAYAAQVAARIEREPRSFNPLDFFQAFSVIQVRDWRGTRDAQGRLRPVTDRSALKAESSFADSVHGVLSARSGPERDAAFLMFEARPDLRGVGHQHHDAGHFYFTALGLPWAVEAGPKNSYSLDHNVVAIDGQGLADVVFAPRVDLLPPSITPQAAFATANLKNAYDHGWVTPMHPYWRDPAQVDGTRAITPETDPLLVEYYRGTQHTKTRLWGTSYFTENWGPIMRVAGNAVEVAYRSAGLVRGLRPYALIVDDRRKDTGEHLYEWLMQVPDGVRIANLAVAADSVPAVLLTQAPAAPGWHREATEKLPPGTPLLLVALLEDPVGPSAHRGNQLDFVTFPLSLRQLASPARTGSKSVSLRLVIEQRARTARFRVLLIPTRAGEPTPKVTWRAAEQTAEVTIGNQRDTLVFTTGADDRSRFTIRRAGAVLLELR